MMSAEYRSAIFYTDDKQKSIAEEVRDQVQKEHFTPIGASVSWSPWLPGPDALSDAPQARPSVPHSNRSRRMVGSMPKITTRSTSTRIPVDTSALHIGFIGS